MHMILLPFKRMRAPQCLIMSGLDWYFCLEVGERFFKSSKLVPLNQNHEVLAWCGLDIIENQENIGYCCTCTYTISHSRPETRKSIFIHNIGLVSLIRILDTPMAFLVALIGKVIQAVLILSNAFHIWNSSLIIFWRLKSLLWPKCIDFPFTTIFAILFQPTSWSNFASSDNSFYFRISLGVSSSNNSPFYNRNRPFAQVQKGTIIYNTYS